ncbi:hypothetical protein [Collinsella tanakaei]|uniref:hypothetical protein n=1 Tax=Collinsella tanakaei TaxID=626935 RepID=UPI002F95E4E4
MALYLPDLHVAFEVTDDPASAPVDASAFPGLTTIHVTANQLDDPGLLAKAIERAQVGRDLPSPASAQNAALQAVRAASRLR